MASLSARTICRNFNITQINAKIDFYVQAIEDATVKLYDKDTTQGRQRVESADLKDIESLLQVWLSAKDCKNGVGGTQIVSGNFRAGNRGAIV